MDAVLGNSKAVLEELRAEGASPNALRLIYNGVSLDVSSAQRREVRAALSIQHDALLIVCVANLIPYKGHADLIEAFGAIASHLPKAWRLICVGRDDGIQESLSLRCQALGIDDNVLFLGARRDVESLQRASDIGVLASHEEGFSNAVLEGMVQGLPLVVTDVGGNREAVLDGLNGIVVSPNSPSELSKAIIKLASDPQLRMKMGRQARERARSRFSQARCVAAYDQLYRDLLGLSPPLNSVSQH